MNKNKAYIGNLKKAWRDENAERNKLPRACRTGKEPGKESIFIRMAEAEDRHAERWTARLKELALKSAHSGKIP